MRRGVLTVFANIKISHIRNYAAYAEYKMIYIDICNVTQTKYIHKRSLNNKITKTNKEYNRKRKNFIAIVIFSKV